MLTLLLLATLLTPADEAAAALALAKAARDRPAPAVAGPVVAPVLPAGPALAPPFAYTRTGPVSYGGGRTWVPAAAARRTRCAGPVCPK